MTDRQKIFLAPGIHCGGGLVLLEALLPHLSNTRFFLDARAKEQLGTRKGEDITWVKPGFWSRLMLESWLFISQRKISRIFCFSSLPPLLPTRAKVSLFIQNKLLVEKTSLHQYPLSTRMKIFCARWWLLYRTRRWDHLIVQTHAMKRACDVLWTKKRPISVYPLFEGLTTTSPTPFFLPDQSFDFCYIADAQPHKNHDNLLKAWDMLAQEKIFPSLALTITRSDISPERTLQNCSQIAFLGPLKRLEVFALYEKSKALIFPSCLESFALPLIEARTMQKPILASESDFVRDVCSPFETFDPHSPLSIARAVKRFLQLKMPDLFTMSPAQFAKVISS